MDYIEQSWVIALKRCQPRSWQIVIYTDSGSLSQHSIMGSSFKDVLLFLMAPRWKGAVFSWHRESLNRDQGRETWNMGIWRNKKRILSVIHLALSFLFFFSSSEKPLTVDISPGSWVAAQVGDSVVLTCAVVGCDSPTFSWRTQTNGSLNGEVRRAGATSTLTLSPVSFENENSYLCTVTCAQRKLEKEIQVEVYCKCFSKWMTHWLLPFPLVPLEEKGCDCVRKSICAERGLASLDLWTLLDAIQLVRLSGIYCICLQTRAHCVTGPTLLLHLSMPHAMLPPLPHVYRVRGAGEWEQPGPCVHSDKDSVRGDCLIYSNWG